MNFKNKVEYEAQKQSLMNEISDFLNAGKQEEAEEKLNQVEQLENKWQEDAVELANKKSLEEKFKNLSNLGGKEKMEKDKIENVVITDDAIFRNAWLKNLQGKGLSTDESQMMNAAAVASAAIPTQTLNKIVSIVEQSPILNAIDLTYIPSNVTYPVEDAMADATWVAMGTAATDSTATLTSITLNAYKLIKTVEVTADVQNMAIDAFESWLTARLGEKIRKALDAAVFTGTGTNQAKGIETSISTATGTYTKAGMTYKDLCKIMAELGAEYTQNAVFAMPRKLFFSDVLGMEDTSKKPVVVQDLQSPAKYNILGYPVILDDNITADTVIFGDFKYYKMNISKLPAVEQDDSVGFRTGSTCYRAMCLADGKVATTNAFVLYTRATA